MRHPGPHLGVGSGNGISSGYVSLIESGHLQGTRGRHRLVTPIERLAVPASVQAVLAAGIDRLPEREKRVLQAAAAVIGKVFSEPLLLAAAELPEGELRAALATLKAHEFVERGPDPEGAVCRRSMPPRSYRDYPLATHAGVPWSSSEAVSGPAITVAAGG